MDLSNYSIQQLNAVYTVINRQVLLDGLEPSLRDAIAHEIESRVDDAHEALLQAHTDSATTV